jgi:hypothetical protein
MQSDKFEEAFANAVNSLRPGMRFPENVFVGPWQNFLFFESDALFFGKFTWGIKEFLRIERSTSACLVNLDRREDGAERTAIRLDNQVTNDSYQEQLRAGTVESAWLYAMERYVCASDGGTWCIYAEKANDVAVVALRNVGASTQFHYALSYFGADTLTYLLRTQFPFTELVSHWRAGLIRNYKPSKGRNAV